MAVGYPMNDSASCTQKSTHRGRSQQAETQFNNYARMRAGRPPPMRVLAGVVVGVG